MIAIADLIAMYSMSYASYMYTHKSVELSLYNLREKNILEDKEKKKKRQQISRYLPNKINISKLEFIFNLMI